ncbi:MAG: right-handed parallel beta-helix repeat-containing protein, partial [Candidatus Methylomirabilis sp.]|nr:right-handed parallel beta-helix repeat-containing protein [Deltaproteobacteria bacterium]
GSSDPDGDALTHQWLQLSGPSATLSDPAAVSPTFAAPNVTADATLLFQLTVSDGEASSVASVRITVQNQTAPTVFVDASNASGIEDGSADHPFNTIAEGVAAAADGAIVQIAAGVYAESLSIAGRSVGLYASAGPDATSVTGAAGSTVTSSTQVSIDGLTFTGSASDGLRLASSTYVTLRNCKFTGNLHNGLYGEGVPGLVIADSEFTGNGSDGAAESTGALLIDADYLTVSGSKFNGNGVGDAHAPPSTITAVKDVHGNGLAVEDASFVDIQSSEFKDNLWVGLFLNQGPADEAVSLAGLTAAGNDGAGVVIANAVDVTASGGVVSDNGPASGAPYALFGGHGLAMTGVRSVSWTGASEFSRNRGSGVAWGLGAFDQDIALSGATVADNDGHGVAFDFSAGVTVSGCSITGNAGFGVGVRSSSNVQVAGNTISLNGDSGVGAINAKNAVTVSGNVAIASNADYGIECGLGSALTCSANNLSGNTTGAIKTACGAGCAD